MADFQTRVENYTGATDEDLGDYLTAAAKEVLELVPKDKLRFYAQAEADSGSGVAIDGKRLAYVTKSGRYATELPSGLKAAATDSDSIHFATEFSPAFVVDNGTAHVYPSGGSVHTVDYPTVAQADIEITNFPDELEEAVCVLAAIKWTTKQDDLEKVPTLQDIYQRIVESYLGTNPSQ